MGLPAKLKQMNLYNEGLSHLSQIPELTPPEISHVMEDWRGGGMLGAVKIDFGLEPLAFEWKIGGYSAQVVSQMGRLQIDGVLLRALGGFQAEDTGQVIAVELVMMGRHQNLSRGNWQPGSDTEVTIRTELSYYKEIVDGRELLEIDMVRGIYIVDGVDRYAELRAAIGA